MNYGPLASTVYLNDLFDFEGVSDEESDAGLQEAQETEAEQPDSKLSTIASGVGTTSHSFFFFGDGVEEEAEFQYGTLSSIPDVPVGLFLFFGYCMSGNVCKLSHCRAKIKGHKSKGFYIDY